MDFFKRLFSYRKQIQVPPVKLFVDQLSPDITNAINNCFEHMWNSYSNLQRDYYGLNELNQKHVEEELWTHFLNLKLSDFEQRGQYYTTSVNVINDSTIPWYKKLDLIEYVVKFLHIVAERHHLTHSSSILESFINELNFEFKRLDYAYRVVNYEIVEVNSEEEIQAITNAINDSKDNVREHLRKALSHYAERPNSDIRNSIKESISAVEAVCRELTGEQTLGKALKKLEDNGVVLHPTIKNCITQLYVYTNDSSTGIRHALMDSAGTYLPSKEEAYFMLLNCSVFINYIRMKIAIK